MKNSRREITQTCDDIKAMLIDKNNKYGDSALNPVRIMSKSDTVEQIKVRIDDKLSRLSQGHINDDEDVINDLIGYFILLKIAKQRDDITNEEDSSYEHSDYYYDYDRNGRISTDVAEKDFVNFWESSSTNEVDKISIPSYNTDY